MAIGARVWVGAHAGMAALFGVAAGLQYNDPDPLRWVAIYLFAGVVCVATALGARGACAMAAVVAVISLGWAAAIGGGAWGRTTMIELFEPMEIGGGPIEIGRETSGLIIIAVWMGVVWWRGRAHVTKAS